MRVYEEVGQKFPKDMLTILEGLPVDDEEALEARIEAFKAEHGYLVHDTISISSETPNEALSKFDKPHTHSEDEVRLFLEGEGIFDLRDDKGVWFRFILEKGDMIVVPAGRVHRFEPTFRKSLKCVRIFKDSSGWVPEYVK